MIDQHKVVCIRTWNTSRPFPVVSVPNFLAYARSSLLVLLFLVSLSASRMLALSFSVRGLSFPIWSRRTVDATHSENWRVGVIVRVDVTGLSKVNGVLKDAQLRYGLYRRVVRR